MKYSLLDTRTGPSVSSAQVQCNSVSGKTDIQYDVMKINIDAQSEASVSSLLSSICQFLNICLFFCFYVGLCPRPIDSQGFSRRVAHL